MGHSPRPHIFSGVGIIFPRPHAPPQKKIINPTSEIYVDNVVVQNLKKIDKNGLKIVYFQVTKFKI